MRAVDNGAFVPSLKARRPTDRCQAAFERRVVVFFGNWIPQVVDEQLTPGVWLSGGNLALGEHDHNAA